jgi:hypothetical protein
LAEIMNAGGEAKSVVTSAIIGSGSAIAAR